MAQRVQIKINLMALSRQAFSDRRVQKAVAPILKDRTFKREYGQRLIDEIVRRTRDENVDINGKKFEGYSKTYESSQVFEIYGKSEKTVDLTLTGEMLSNMIVRDNSSDGIRLEFASQEQNDKAHGHINGIPKKRGKRVGKVVRDFFGVPEDKQVEILKATIKDFNEKDFAAADELQTLAENSNVVGTEGDDGG